MDRGPKCWGILMRNAVNAGLRIFLSTDVIDANVHLFLSRDSRSGDIWRAGEFAPHLIDNKYRRALLLTDRAWEYARVCWYLQGNKKGVANKCEFTTFFANFKINEIVPYVVPGAADVRSVIVISYVVVPVFTDPDMTAGRSFPSLHNPLVYLHQQWGYMADYYRGCSVHSEQTLGQNNLGYVSFSIYLFPSIFCNSFPYIMFYIMLYIML